MTDIVKGILTADHSNICMPRFYAVDLFRLPGIGKRSEQGLNKELFEIREEMKGLKDSVSMLLKISTVAGLGTATATTTVKNSNNENVVSNLNPSAAKSSSLNNEEVIQLVSSEDNYAGARPKTPMYAEVLRTPQINQGGFKSLAHSKSSAASETPAEIVRNKGKQQLVIRNDGWNTLTRRPRPAPIIEKRKASIDVSQGLRAKSAPKTSDIYVGRCNIECTAGDVLDIISDEGIEVLECVPLNTMDISSTSFRLRVSYKDRLQVLSPDLWPEGILVRNFYSKKHNDV